MILVGSVLVNVAKWMFPKIGVPQNRWFIMENPVKMDDLGGKPSIFGSIQIYLDHGSYWGMKVAPLLGKKCQASTKPWAKSKTDRASSNSASGDLV